MGQKYGRIDRSILGRLPARTAHSHKGTYGKLLCVAGSVGMVGAAYLCAHAAYRAGAGLVRVVTPEENRVILQELLPEAILTTFDREHPNWGKIQKAFSWADAAAVGPGLGEETWARAVTERALLGFEGPLVLDADGLNALSAMGAETLLSQRRASLIVTPHVGEFSRLSGVSVKEIAASVPDHAVRFAVENRCVCVLKDAPTAVGTPEGTAYVNTSGNNGMATAGSGDVLTGIIAGLLAQWTKPEDAALLGVWLHGRAGDLAAEKEGYYGLMARHLIEYLPEAMAGKADQDA
ncbi:MAG: NAD(P)H-hydrate dehydratase [Lachnospiraceae bacterium]|nr:NAD(P)H-hydrate dehydratase [Lachnospiraceae bacterium]